MAALIVNEKKNQSTVYYIAGISWEADLYGIDILNNNNM